MPYNDLLNLGIEIETYIKQLEDTSKSLRFWWLNEKEVKNVFQGGTRKTIMHKNGLQMLLMTRWFSLSSKH